MDNKTADANLNYAQGVTQDYLLGGAVHLFQPVKGYRVGVDSVLLASSISTMLHTQERILDAGCGVGGISLCMAARLPHVRICGIDIQSENMDLFHQNARLNQYQDRLEGWHGDLFHDDFSHLRQDFDQVVTNPPYFGQGTPANNLHRAISRGGQSLEQLEQWIMTCLKFLRHKGRFTMVHSADKLTFILNVLKGKAGDIAVLPLFSRPHSTKAMRVILSCRKGISESTKLLRGINLHGQNGHAYDEIVATCLNEPTLLPLHE